MKESIKSPSHLSHQLLVPLEENQGCSFLM